ncbi:hypothetical protein Ent8706_05855 [Enterobacter kobei]|uniref:Uncharacterized protein n=1 Tax=Enterobacter kobei TaxID=208224 RepID=A0A2J0PHN6_9ENTR|nr:hypothetical protein ECENHK_00580 [Enterobacter kobei]AIX52823.1 hypothetical protein ECNIH4_00590 [Enterobacter cloacae]OWS67791.1 hypothetical protein WM88_04835 [Enterobacter cloacae complex sp. ECNIH6]POV54990.1 hypothetical protein C3379_15000 [Enterobacter cloacae complex sp. ECNIH10]POV81441.1 hypothetical protein C3382_16425 [Enterobacter cloacae complex sp. ECNIH9]
MTLCKIYQTVTELDLLFVIYILIQRRMYIFQQISTTVDSRFWIIMALTYVKLILKAHKPNQETQLEDIIYAYRITL